MTYKELLFKMAEKKMLTLSADKDGRGLFWAGMDNMDALGQKVDIEDLTTDYPKDDVAAMRKTLHEAECNGVMSLSEVLWEGCVGWGNIPDKEVIEMYENIYGETDNVEIIQK